MILHQFKIQIKGPAIAIFLVPNCDTLKEGVLDFRQFVTVEG